jgi:hypothetical protein
MGQTIKQGTELVLKGLPCFRNYTNDNVNDKLDKVGIYRITTVNYAEMNW